MLLERSGEPFALFDFLIHKGRWTSAFPSHCRLHRTTCLIDFLCLHGG